MTDDDFLDRFTEITSDDELDPLRDLTSPKPRRGFRYHATWVVLVIVIVAFIGLGLWLLVHAAAWAGNHGMLPAPN